MRLIAQVPCAKDLRRLHENVGAASLELPAADRSASKPRYSRSKWRAPALSAPLQQRIDHGHRDKNRPPAYLNPNRGHAHPLIRMKETGQGPSTPESVLGGQPPLFPLSKRGLNHRHPPSPGRCRALATGAPSLRIRLPNVTIPLPNTRNFYSIRRLSSAATDVIFSLLD
jgi:hypothetical protein